MQHDRISHIQPHMGHPGSVVSADEKYKVAGLILRVRRGVGEPNRIYTLLPKKEDCRDE